MAIDWESLINELAAVAEPATTPDPLRAVTVEAPTRDPERHQEGSPHWLFGWVTGSTVDLWQC